LHLKAGNGSRNISSKWLETQSLNSSLTKGLVPHPLYN